MSDSQKFLSRNRAPRVQIEYDVEVYGAQKKVQLPFVMGVLSDLSGKAEKPPVAERKFLEIDAVNFDERMRAMTPRVQFSVPNTLTGEGSLPIDLTFQSMNDFSPAAIAARVETLAPLLEARQHLTNLLAYMDGKPGAEKLLEALLGSPELLSALAGQRNMSDETDNVLDALRSAAPDLVTPEDTQSAALDALRANVPEDDEDEPEASDILADLGRAAPDEAPADDMSDILAGLPTTEAPPEETGIEDDILAGLQRTEDTPETDRSSEILAGIERLAKPDTADETSAVLDNIERAELAETDDDPTDILSGIRTAEPETRPDPDPLDSLASLERIENAPDVDHSDDILAGIDRTDETAVSDMAADILSGLERSEENPVNDDVSDILAGIEPVAEEGLEGGLEDILAEIATVPEEPDTENDDILSGLGIVEEPEPGSDLDDILAGLEASSAESEPAQPADSLDAALSGLEPIPDTTSEPQLDDLLAGLDIADDENTNDEAEDVLAALAVDDAPNDGDADIDDILGELEAVAEEPPNDDATAPSGGQKPIAADTGAVDLDDILAGSDLRPEGVESDVGGREDIPDEPASEAPDSLDDLTLDLTDDADLQVATNGETELEDLLSDLEPTVEEPETDLDDLFADLDDNDDATESATDLDELLGDIDDDFDASGGQEESPNASATPEATKIGGAPQEPFGTISTPRPDRASLNRSKFRIALFGDFTGRAARGLREIGDALAERQPIELDVDTVEDIIERFGTRLSLPIGKDGIAVEVPLHGLDDLHPDELYENVAIFDALASLRQQLTVGSMAEKAAERLKGWSETFGTPVCLPKRSAATSIPANRKLSDFQALIGDHSGTLAGPSPVEDLLARIVGPHLVHMPDADARAMISAVDDAASTAMRLILHHPDFQAIEAQWRTLDLLARRVETDSSLQIVLYDISAEELAMDLAEHEDLSRSGLFRLLTDELDPETGGGGFSALMGLYVFEETPPHAELLARIAKVAAHVDAPFIAAISPGYLDVEKEDRHPLVARAWDQLRALPEASWLGLASPRFLLRLPYGARTEPIDPFDFEEFTPREGLAGLLWANPVALAAILLAATYKKDGRGMNLGSVMSLGDLPFHYVTDRHGDQVAMPCTERNLTTDPAQKTLARGFMPVVWMKGRNEIRLASFNALGGSALRGPWTGQTPIPPAPDTKPDIAMAIQVATTDADATDEAELDNLLAGFEENLDLAPDGGDNENEMDAELAALLEGL